MGFRAQQNTPSHSSPPLERVRAPEARLGPRWPLEQPGPIIQEQTGLFEDHGAHLELDGALGQESIVPYSKRGTLRTPGASGGS